MEQSKHNITIKKILQIKLLSVLMTSTLMRLSPLILHSMKIPVHKLPKLNVI